MTYVNVMIDIDVTSFRPCLARGAVSIHPVALVVYLSHALILLSPLVVGDDTPTATFTPIDCFGPQYE